MFWSCFNFILCLICLLCYLLLFFYGIFWGQLFFRSWREWDITFIFVPQILLLYLWLFLILAYYYVMIVLIFSLYILKHSPLHFLIVLIITMIIFNMLRYLRWSCWRWISVFFQELFITFSHNADNLWEKLMLYLWP